MTSDADREVIKEFEMSIQKYQGGKYCYFSALFTSAMILRLYGSILAGLIIAFLYCDKDIGGMNNMDYERQIILFPVGGKVAQEHYEKLVKSGVKFPGDNSEKLRKIWGATNGTNGINSTKFEKIKEGDIAFFVKNTEIIAYAIITQTIPHRKDIAKQVIDDEVWENILILADPVYDVKFDLLQINEILSYSPSYRVQGFNVLDSIKSHKIIEKLNITFASNLHEKSVKIEDEQRKFKIFISYSHADEAYKDELKKHMIILQENHRIEIWDDRQLILGQEYNEVFSSKMDQADIIIILISSDYFASDYCMHKEWPYIKANHKEKTIPIIIRDCLWEEMLEKVGIMTLPQNKGNIFSSNDTDKEYKLIVTNILTKIREIEEFEKKER